VSASIAAAPGIAENRVLAALVRLDRERTQATQSYCDQAERAGQGVPRLSTSEVPSAAAVGDRVHVFRLRGGRTPQYQVTTLMLTDGERAALRNVGEIVSEDLGTSWRYFGQVDGRHLVVECGVEGYR